MKFITQFLVEWYLTMKIATYITDLVFDPAQKWSYFLGYIAFCFPTVVILSIVLKKAYEVHVTTQNIIQLKGEGVATLTDEQLSQFKAKLKELEESK